MKILSVLLFLLAGSTLFYRGWLVHNYLRNKQKQSDVNFLSFYNELLNKLWLNELMLVVPFFSTVQIPEIKRKQHRINLLTLLFYLELGAFIFAVNK